jgi:hypothetical protein
LTLFCQFVAKALRQDSFAELVCQHTTALNGEASSAGTRRAVSNAPSEFRPFLSACGSQPRAPCHP